MTWTRESWRWPRTRSTPRTRAWPTGCGTTRRWTSSSWPAGRSNCCCQDYGGSRDPAPQDRDRRHGLLGPRHGDQAEAGGRGGLRAPRARRRHRRHLAGQHLPRLPLRRAVASLLLLVRAESQLVQHLLAAGGDPRLPEGLRRALRRAAPYLLRHRARERAVGRRRGAVADRDLDRLDDGELPRGRAGAAVRPRAAGGAGPRGLR